MTIITTDSGLNTSTACTTSRSPTPELNEDISLMTFEIDSIFNQTLTKENNSLKQKEKKICQKSRSNRVKRVLKRYIEKIFYFYIYI
jgi:oligoendopeptidase F